MTANLDAFLEWCKGHGIAHPSIAPVHTPSSGLGIRSVTNLSGPATSKTTSTAPGSSNARQRRGLNPGETLVSIPPSLLLNRDTVYKFTSRLPRAEETKELSTHALLATAIWLERKNPENPWAPWIQTFPTLQDFQDFLPLLWTPEQQALLPSSALKLLKAQQKDYDLDLTAVQGLGLVPAEEEEQWTWAWFIVNTRTLFYTPNETEGRTRRDYMSLCPFVDIFNHTSTADCKVDFDPAKGYVVTVDNDVTETREVFVSYGCHSNDFLFIHYGFLLSDNRWDEVCVDSHVFRVLEEQLGGDVRGVLRSEGFEGGYVFDCNEEFCYRTKAAVRLLAYGGHEDMWRCWLRGEDEGEEEEPECMRVLRGILGSVREEMEEKSEGVMGVVGQRGELLRQRWREVAAMVERAEENLKA